jgi:hypothetical protein
LYPDVTADPAAHDRFRTVSERSRRRPVENLPDVFEDEEWFGAMCGCLGERDGFSEAFERERLASGDAQHFISDETANLG